MDKAYSQLLARTPEGTFDGNIARIVKPPRTSPSPSLASPPSYIAPECFKEKIEIVGAHKDNRQLGPLGIVPPGFGALFAAYVSHRDKVPVDERSLYSHRPFVMPDELMDKEVEDGDIQYLANVLFQCREKRIQVLDPFFEHIESDTDALGAIVKHALETLVRNDQWFSNDQQSE